MACGDLPRLLAGPLGWAADALFKALGGRPADAPEPEAENLAAETADETWAAARAALPKLYAGPLLAAAGLQGDMQNGSVSRLRPAGEAQAAHCTTLAQGHRLPGCTALTTVAHGLRPQSMAVPVHTPLWAACAVWHAWPPHYRQAVHPHEAQLCDSSTPDGNILPGNKGSRCVPSGPAGKAVAEGAAAVAEDPSLGRRLAAVLSMPVHDESSGLTAAATSMWPPRSITDSGRFKSRPASDSALCKWPCTKARSHVVLQAVHL